MTRGLRAAAALAAAGALALAPGCAHAPRALPADVEARLAAPGAFLAGPPAGLEELAVLNEKDYVWATAWAPDARTVGFVHLPRGFQVSLWRLPLGRTPAPAASATVGHSEHDAEGLAFSPDGAQLAVVTRDGRVRLYAAADAALKAEVLLEEPLVSVAYHPGGRALVVGSSKGLVTVLRLPDLAHLTEVRAHAEEVRALAFAPDGTLYSGGWDRRVRAFTTREGPLDGTHARVRFEREGGLVRVRATVNGRAALGLGLDERSPHVVLETKAAQAAGIDAAFLKEEATLPLAMGPTVVKLARGAQLRFKGLVLDGVDVAVCGGCVPPGLAGLLGAPFFQRVAVAFDPAAEEARLTLRAPPAGPAEQGVQLAPAADFALQEAVNDVTVDAAGARLGVAVSAEPARRTPEVYAREKKGVKEPHDVRNAALLLDARTGAELARWTDHAGVVATAGISPDGRSLLSGGWDAKVHLHTEGTDKPIAAAQFGRPVRRARIAPDGRHASVAAWTPINPVGDQESDPAAVLYQLRYTDPKVSPAPLPLGEGQGEGQQR